MGRKGDPNSFYDFAGSVSILQERLGTIHSDEGITRQPQEGLDVSDAAALNPTLLHGSTVNPVTDILGFQTGEQPCVGISRFFLVAHRKQEILSDQGVFFNYLPQ